MPRAMISDGGFHFCNRPFASLMHKYGVTHKVTTAYHLYEVVRRWVDWMVLFDQNFVEVGFVKTLVDWTGGYWELREEP